MSQSGCSPFSILFIYGSALLACVVGLASGAQARVFNFDEDTFAPYLRGTFGPSLLGSDAYGNSSGVGTSFDRSVSANYSGEFGILMSSGRFGLRLGGELLLPATMGTVTGSNSSGTLFTLNSTTSAIIAQANIEYAIRRGPTSKFLFSFGGGYGMVNLTNVYTMTPAGTAATGLGNFTETAGATVPEGQASLIYEFLFADSATLALEAGYRYMEVSQLTYTGAQKTFAGSETSGATVINNSGSPRSLNLGGPFAGISLRFYFSR